MVRRISLSAAALATDSRDRPDVRRAGLPATGDSRRLTARTAARRWRRPSSPARGSTPHGRRPERTWQPLERLLADTTDARRRAVLSVVIEHMKAEARPDMDRLMATWAGTGLHRFWIDGQNAGPNGTDGVRAYGVRRGRGECAEFEIDRLVLDDDCLVTEGWLKVLYPGAAAWYRHPGARSGRRLPGGVPSADPLAGRRRWSIRGEDAYHSGPVSVTALSHADLPDPFFSP